LGDVLEALDKKMPHVPYRNSKLTHVLQDSLSANSRTLMICAVPPTSVTADETLFTLQVSTVAAGLANAPALQGIRLSVLFPTVRPAHKKY
jgi:hypothetical protein